MPKLQEADQRVVEDAMVSLTAEMWRHLDANAEKGVSWRQMKLDVLIGMLRDRVTDLSEAIPPAHCTMVEMRDVMHQAAHVANYAMFMFDIARLEHDLQAGEYGEA